MNERTLVEIPCPACGYLLLIDDCDPESSVCGSCGCSINVGDILSGAETIRTETTGSPEAQAFSKRLAARARPTPPRSVRSKKTCPYCRASIPVNATKCQQCSEWLIPVKMRWLYVVLGLLVGPLGIHNFYIGRVGPGLLQCAATILAGFMSGVASASGGGLESETLYLVSIIVAAIVWAIALFEVCTITQDADGNPLH